MYYYSTPPMACSTFAFDLTVVYHVRSCSRACNNGPPFLSMYYYYTVISQVVVLILSRYFIYSLYIKVFGPGVCSSLVIIWIPSIDLLTINMCENQQSSQSLNQSINQSVNQSSINQSIIEYLIYSVKQSIR